MYSVAPVNRAKSAPCLDLRLTSPGWEVTLKGMRVIVCLLAASGLLGCGGMSPDEQPLLAPPPSGVQLNFGPFAVPSPSEDVNDPGVVPGEVQLCRTLKLPNDQKLAVDRLEVAMNQGSHHFILFRSTQDFPDQIFPCWGTVNFDDWEFVVDVNRTGGNDWKLTDGQAFVFEPHQQVMLQAHFVNANMVTAPLGGKVTANLYATDLAKVAHQLHGLFTVNTAIAIPPGETYTTPTRKCTFSKTAFITSMTGHFHARGTLFDVHEFYHGKMITPGHFLPDIDAAQLYQSTSWDAPPFKIFDPPTMLAESNQGVEFACSYQNDTPNFIGWGGHADTQEHCNLFLQYYNVVDDGPLLTCDEGSAGW